MYQLNLVLQYSILVLSRDFNTSHTTVIGVCSFYCEVDLAFEAELKS